MISTQMWSPDTHPGLELHSEWLQPTPPEGGWRGDIPPATFLRCFEAVLNGVPLDDPDTVYALVIEENQRKNQADALIVATLPASMKKPVLDSDGDPTGEMIVKDKHRPQWVFGEADGKLSVSIPGADDAVLATVREALAGFGNAVTVV